MQMRGMRRIVSPTPVTDGGGVNMERLIGTRGLDHVDPFLLFDAFGSERGADYIQGFPEHPHRGIETVTYMLAGRMRHGDNQGRTGELGPGDVQWMTAGRGIVHSEMPLQEDGLLRGFQIWVNLPGSHKMMAPRYQDIPASQIPVSEPAPGLRAKVIAGEFAGTQGAVEGILADPLYLDLGLEAGACVDVPIAPGHTAIVYAHAGSPRIGGQELQTGQLAVLGEGEAARLEAEAPAQLLLLAAKPFNEPVVRYGPFVMTSREEIAEAVQDYQAGRF